MSKLGDNPLSFVLTTNSKYRISVFGDHGKRAVLLTDPTLVFGWQNLLRNQAHSRWCLLDLFTFPYNRSPLVPRVLPWLHVDFYWTASKNGYHRRNCEQNLAYIVLQIYLKFALQPQIYLHAFSRPFVVLSSNLKQLSRNSNRFLHIVALKISGSNSTETISDSVSCAFFTTPLRYKKGSFAYIPLFRNAFFFFEFLSLCKRMYSKCSIRLLYSWLHVLVQVSEEVNISWEFLHFFV